MSYATVALVKELGGLNSDDDYNLFRFRTPDELDAAIVRKIAVAASWLRSQIPSAYATTDADELVLFAEGEAYLALHFLGAALKARRVFGTHYPFDQEGSERFAELVDVEWKQLAQDLLGEWLTVTETPTSFARPTFQIGPVIDLRTDTTIDSEEVQVAERAERARGMTDSIAVVTP